MAQLRYICIAALCGLAFVYGQNVQPVTEICLGCICEAVSNCNRTLTCEGDVCGIFRITWAYWVDAGKPILANDNPNDKDAYPRCVNDPVCAAKTVTDYMTRFAKDCNGDNVINCDDYAAIHRLGGYGCNAPLDYPYYNKYTNCQREVQNLFPQYNQP